MKKYVKVDKKLNYFSLVYVFVLRLCFFPRMCSLPLV